MYSPEGIGINTFHKDKIGQKTVGNILTFTAFSPQVRAHLVAKEEEEEAPPAAPELRQGESIKSFIIIIIIIIIVIIITITLISAILYKQSCCS